MLTSLTIHRSNIIIFQVYHLVGMLNHSTEGRGREKEGLREREGGVEEEKEEGEKEGLRERRRG